MRTVLKAQSREIKEQWVRKLKELTLQRMFRWGMLAFILFYIIFF